MSMHHFTWNRVEGSTGAVIRDVHGVFVAAACSHICHVTDAHTAESAAMKQGLLVANTLAFHSIQIESDSVEVINGCMGQREFGTSLRHLMQSASSWLE